jgi:Bacterial regulatory proteins, luxR family
MVRNACSRREFGFPRPTGLSNTEIAEHLHLSLATVKTHVGHLLAKLQARDRAQLVIVAYETGLVSAMHQRWSGPCQRPGAWSITDTLTRPCCHAARRVMAG